MPDSPSQPSSFTGRKRELRNRTSVRWADKISRVVITLGGIGTIIAVSLVCLQLVWVVIPLLKPGEIGTTHNSQIAATDKPLHLGFDEYKTLGWTLSQQGVVSVFRLDNGEQVDQITMVETEPAISSISVGRSGDVAIGFADGTVRLGDLGFKSTFPDPASLPEAMQNLDGGEMAVFEKGILQRTGQGELRHQKFEANIKPPVAVVDSAVVLIDHVIATSGPVFAVYSADGKVRINTVREKQNLLTGETTFKARTSLLPLEPRKFGQPKFICISGLGDNVSVAWEDGRLYRFDTRNMDQPELAEQVELLSQRDAKLVELKYLLGRATLIAADSEGNISAWFRIRPEGPDAVSIDGQHLVQAHELPGAGAAVTSLGMSSRSRMLTAGYADGKLRVFNVTTEALLVESEVAEGKPIEFAAIAPKEDGLFALDGQRLWQADFDPAYPEATPASLFMPIWYEGYAQPDHVWQSGGGSEELEAKLGLWPLVFGTLKATAYSMLIAVPLALLAAIYTSEFMHPRVRAKVKPTIELMASLPSVVLGFLAGLIFAPIIEKIVPSVLASFITVPLSFLLGALVWQSLPIRLTLRLGQWRLFFMFPVLFAGLGCAFLVGPWMEQWFFAGDMMRWLDGQVGNAIGGWMMTLLPLASVLVAVLIGVLVNPWLRAATSHWNRPAVARLSAAKFVVGTLFAFSAALLVSYLLNLAGFDARGVYLGTYDPRNALVVGFVMGFAVIPIIYTIADDALHTVPQHLRSGSLGAGATRWQTAIRIVIPTAMSGLFSAVMIGLGRAVGETMIVLMATGNTPVRDWNIFNGFRTLAANIAVEVPEAAKDSTHYRTLFLAALTLFVLTFTVNTIAEVVRLRFRRRAIQL